MALHKLKAFHTPRTLEEALALVGNDEQTLVLSGGTFLHGLEARGLLGDVLTLVDVRRIGLNAIQSGAARLDLGATATLAQLQAVPDIARDPALAALADALKHPPAQIRHAATVGGCVAAACPFFDIPTALLALDAEVRITGRKGARQLPLRAFSTGLFANALAGGELVTGVIVARTPGPTASAFLKLEGNANDLAIVNTAVRITLAANGTCSDARVALGGGVAESVVRSASAEKILTGARLDAAALQAAAEAIGRDIAPMSDHRASAQYRKVVAKVLVRRALERALARSSQGAQR